jgi:trk/ktr system potassium uptake protein
MKRLPRHRSWVNQWTGPWGSTTKARRRSFWRRLTPVQLFVGSFLLLIVLGTLGFEVLPGLYTGAKLGWLDALFTATSAVCVTGLIVVDTATAFTTFGQAYLLLLIQLGGLGMITFASLVILGLGGRLSLRQEQLTSVAEVAPHIDYRELTRNVIRFTLFLEGLGALLLWLDWGPRIGWTTAVWHSIFNSVSAFCNAGFSTFSDSLISFQRDPISLTLIMLLIIAGGLGFLTLQELHLLRDRKNHVTLDRISVHSRLALAVTGILILVGWVLYTVFEWRRTLVDMPAWARVWNGLFMSVTARTAGYNSMDYAQVSQVTAFLTVLLMFIGGSPGGTAGGVKTTTVALIGLLAWSRLRGRNAVNIMNRTVPDETIHRAIGLFVAAFSIVTAGIFLLTAVGLPHHAESALRGDFLALMFEATSAFGTVGLSTGITGNLTAAGRWLAVFLMFLGRIGPLALGAAIMLPDRGPGRFRFAREDVIIG